MAKGRLELQPLRYFVAVAEEGSLRKAAQRLHLSQPPLTRSMQALEELLGRALFERDRQGVLLTEEGRVLLEPARALLAQADRLVESVRAARAAAPKRVRVGVSIGVAPAVLRGFALGWRAALRGQGLELRSEPSPRLAAALRAGEIDVAVVALPLDTSGLHIEPLYDEPLVAALPGDHPAARRKRVRLADLGDTRFFWNPRAFNPAYYDACARVFREAGFRPRYETVEPAQLLTLERIGQGEGCTLVNRSRTPLRIPGLVYRPLAEGQKLAIRYVMAWRDEAQHMLARRLLAAARRRLPAPAMA